MPTSTGIDGQVGGRSAPTVINTVYGKSMFWDGRAPSLEGQAQGPIQNPIEMGKQSYEEIVKRLDADPRLQGAVPEGLRHRRDPRRHGQGDRHVRARRGALGQLAVRPVTIKGDDGRPEREPEARDGPVRPAAQRATTRSRPRASTLQKAKCTLCHVGFNFTDEQFHNLGVGWDEQTRKFADLGRWAIEPIGGKDPASIGAFKTPTLRDVAQTAPYMHDGSQETLEEVMEHYNKGGNANPSLDTDMEKLDLTDQEIADVVAFMEALTGEMKKVELPTFPPDRTARRSIRPPRWKRQPRRRPLAGVTFTGSSGALIARQDPGWKRMNHAASGGRVPSGAVCFARCRDCG